MDPQRLLQATRNNEPGIFDVNLARGDFVIKVPVPGGKAMVMQAKVKGLRKLGEADIEVKIKGQELGELFDLARQTAETMNGLRQFTNVYVSMDMTKPELQRKPRCSSGSSSWWRRR
jgi:hypothetical protein